jgi:hypothetical protein
VKRLLEKGWVTAFTDARWTSRSRIARSLLVTTLIVAAASCGSSEGNRDGRSISIDREVLLFPEWFGGAKAITKLTGGELVVTGTARSAWVFATDSQGTLLWKYQDPVDENNYVQAQSQTAYNGMVPLADGNVLLCGQRNFDRGYKNRILILDRKGNVVDQREEVPGIEVQAIDAPKTMSIFEN